MRRGEVEPQKDSGELAGREPDWSLVLSRQLEYVKQDSREKKLRGRETPEIGMEVLRGLGQTLNGMCARQDSNLIVNRHCKGQGVGTVSYKVILEVTQGEEMLRLWPGNRRECVEYPKHPFDTPGKVMP